MTLRTISLLAAMAAALHAQQNAVLGEETVRVSEHVQAIMGFPNVAIVTGASATLVVDTGMGPRNGRTIAKVAAKLSAPGAKLYLTTTHFHPEHAAGDDGFPPGTTLIRDAVQQKEMGLHGMEMVQMFASRSAQQKELLSDVKLRTPDLLFSDEARIDLGGGVTARLLWLGEAHTKGDELIFIEPDRTLISGDVVQNRTVPNIFGDGGTPASWLAVLDKVAALNPLHVLPDHSAPGDGNLVAAEKAFMTDLRNRALELKRAGASADEAAARIGTEFKTKYADWPSMNVTGFVRSIYAEN